MQHKVIVLVKSEIICLRIFSSSGISSAFLQWRFNTCMGSKRAPGRPNLCTGVEFSLQLKSLAGDPREKPGNVADSSEWKVSAPGRGCGMR